MSHRCRTCGVELQGSSADATVTDCPACRSGRATASTQLTQLTLLTRTSDGETRPVSTFDVPPAFLEAYELQQPVGSGACGMVWRARHRGTDRLVAVKFLVQAPDEVAMKRLLDEGRSLAHLRRPNVLTIYDCGVAPPHPYLVTELLTGGSLRDRLVRDGRFDLATARSIALDCLAGLAACHDLGIVHRDLKPENILFSGEGVPRIVDLGVAKLEQSSTSMTRTGALIGTPTYMSPEQARGDPVGPWSDIYAMGIILYEMVSGKNPFAGGNLVDVIDRHLSFDPPGLRSIVATVPEPFERLVSRALAKQPTSRPANAGQLAQALQQVAAGTPARGRDLAAPIPRPRRRVRRPAPAIPSPPRQARRPRRVDAITPRRPHRVAGGLARTRQVPDGVTSRDDPHWSGERSTVYAWSGIRPPTGWTGPSGPGEMMRLHDHPRSRASRALLAAMVLLGALLWSGCDSTSPSPPAGPAAAPRADSAQAPAAVAAEPQFQPAAPAASNTASASSLPSDQAAKLLEEYRWLSGATFGDTLAGCRQSASGAAGLGEPGARLAREIEQAQASDLDARLAKFRKQLDALPSSDPVVQDLKQKAGALSVADLKAALSSMHSELTNAATPARQPQQTNRADPPNTDDLPRH